MANFWSEQCLPDFKLLPEHIDLTGKYEGSVGKMKSDMYKGLVDLPHGKKCFILSKVKSEEEVRCFAALIKTGWGGERDGNKKKK